MIVTLSALSGLNTLNRLLIQRESQHRERAVVDDFDVRELALVAVEHEASVLGDGERFHFRVFAATDTSGDGDGSVGRVDLIEQDW